MNKVLYIGGFELPDRNAAAQRVVAIAKTMREAGYEVEFIGVTKKKEEVNRTMEFEGFKYTSVQYPSNLKEWLYQIVRFVPIEIIKEKNPTAIVLYNFPAIAQDRITDYCHKKGIKIIADLTEWYVNEGHSPRDIIKRFDTKKRMTDYCFKADGVIAISKYLYDFYRERVKTVYIPATVDMQDLKWERNRIAVIHKPIRLVYAGSPGSGKKDKLNELVKAVAGKKQFELRVYGITKDQYLASFGQTMITDNVKFFGRVSHTEAIRMVCESDFDVIIRDDNLVTRAGFPTKFVEAYSCGVPVIATESSNITDYLIDGINGFIVSECSTLEQVLDRIAEMREEDLISIKEKARSLQAFDYRNYINEIKDILN